MLKILYVLLIVNYWYRIKFCSNLCRKKSRYRFAQLNLGIDVQSSFFGDTKYKDI